MTSTLEQIIAEMRAWIASDTKLSWSMIKKEECAAILSALSEATSAVEEAEAEVNAERAAHTDSLKDAIQGLLAERDAANVYKAKAISRGKLLERFRDHIQNMCDHATDEGDRVYFGSTNDLDELRAIAREMEDWKWDAIMRERPETDPYALCRELRTRAETAERKLAETEQDYEIAAHERDAITSEVAELQRKLAEAVEALRPFAKAAKPYDPPEDDDHHEAFNTKFPIGHLRRAAKIVGEQP